MYSIARTSLTKALRSTASTSSAIASTSKLTLRSNSTASSPTPTSTTTTDTPTPVQYTYFVPRVGKTQTSYPVYTDVRNGGTRIMTEIRKIQGSVSDLQTDLSLFLSETYTDSSLENSPFLLQQVNKKPLRPKPGRKLLDKTANPTYLDPVQSSKVQSSGKLKIRGNRVDEVKAFLQSRGF
ncbi:54S ribosomal protein IMG2, mitochondrial [Pseudozyma hubeiensis]|nr:54S ribosomal protein IMG2, mitochondrial [Pseudozyma hubeiensis]